MGAVVRLDRREPPNGNPPVDRGSRRELVRPGVMVQGAGRENLDFITAFGEPVRCLTHHRLRTSYDGLAVTRSDKGDASCLGIRRIKHAECLCIH